MNPRMKKRMFEGSVLLLALLYSIPLYLIAVNSLKSNNQIQQHPLGFPDFSIGLDNLIRAFKAMEILKAYAVTFSIAIMSLTYIIFFSAMAAYAIARINHWFFQSVYWFYVSLILMPIQAAFIPLIFVLKKFHLYNNLFGISAVYIGVLSSFSIFMFVGFIRGISIELEEAAKIEGCSTLRLFVQIVFPLMKPISATLFIFQFVHIWDDLLLPLVLLTSNKYPTVTLSLYKFFSDLGQTDLSLLFGGFILVLAPVIVMFLFLQKYFVSGLQAGALKG
ncbi:Melibiose/raffinose/stachyose import permease protein MelC [Paenibacillus allorhizoplanae]|uniref:Melibiose/raffinose/stachyose import permease protein MelC n=1 Tax=Paenibacillus allorhizoplanae TaxID=2905648 RepID=A0ABM9CSQ7_9BACL|nr:carbohydrate ABC transporter permease [Paenibacillus allorhizoplanae]CAH1221246.1 Melibiose/raffinose/stachyose import permease protein MelC [Paenibacillus allorhizoplanae]